MKFIEILNELVKPGHKRLASSAGGNATGKKVDDYLSKLDNSGETAKIKKAAKKKGLRGRAAEAYKWAVLHKRMKGHFKK